MVRKISIAIIILISIFSCSRNVIVEDVVQKYEEGNKKVVHYYEENKKGERTWVKEAWFYQEGMKHLEGPIADSKRNGTFKTYYKSGSLMSIGNFKDGKREGKAVVYHENGEVYYEGFYKEGKECGVWKFYDEKGNLYNELNKD